MLKYLVSLILILYMTQLAPVSGKVYFVHRGVTVTPLGHSVIAFDANDLIEWFGVHWNHAGWSVDGEDLLFGASVYGSWFILGAMEKWGNQPPRSVDQLRKFISTVDYSDGEIRLHEDGIAIQCFADDDETEIAWYLFDETFANKYPERVSFILQPEWELEFNPVDPVQQSVILEDDFRFTSTPKISNESGAVYYAVNTGKYLSFDVDCYRCDGIRLDHFGGRIRDAEPELDDLWPGTLRLLRCHAIISGGDSMAEIIRSMDTRTINWIPALDDIMSKSDLVGDKVSCTSKLEDLMSAFLNREKSSRKSSFKTEMIEPLIQSSPHFCQIGFRYLVFDHSGRIIEEKTGRCIFFDDSWASANPNLARSIIYYYGGWDILW
ncbi:MAG: hypothetical protein KDN22_10740 [Verrucomicrobiae bacterium]|nr:hypothetical protein [Verrucomicrobiae bacterium]